MIDAEDHKLRKRKRVYKMLAIFCFVILFLVIFPIEINDKSPRTYSDVYETERVSGLATFIRRVKARGYRVVNHYPTYIQVEISKTRDLPSNVAYDLSKELWRLTGESVKIILVTSEGKYVGYYRPK